uniref:Uncharacterized protein n=1 Tax=Timema bartmani TaxID=61472 RepID=A0A7R9IAR2_9NEOP|nr:unnamed protein product [Timema bartmani]
MFDSASSGHLAANLWIVAPAGVQDYSVSHWPGSPGGTRIGD